MLNFLQFLTEDTRATQAPTVEVEFTDEFEAWWNTLSGDEQDLISAVVLRLSDEGIALGYPYSSAIKTSRHKGMRELRINNKGLLIRVFYIFDPRRVALLLAGANKRGWPGNMDRFYEHFVPVADGIYDEHLRQIGR